MLFIGFAISYSLLFAVRKKWRLMGMSIVLLIWIVVGIKLSGVIKQSLTQRMLDTFYCQQSRTGEALGGLRQNGDSFLDESHCVGPICNEKFIYCSN
jgi:hypothetical protein